MTESEETTSVDDFISADRSKHWAKRLKVYQHRIAEPPQLMVEGKLVRMVGMTLEAIGCQAPLGAICKVRNGDGREIDAEVVGFAEDRLFLMPVSHVNGIVPNSRVIPTVDVYQAPVGDQLLGRVIDGVGKPLDGLGPLKVENHVPIYCDAINPLARKRIDSILDVGVRSINSLLSVGRGQRMGLFAGSGVGKSVLLGMMTRNTKADVIVVGLIGERGREVKEFIETTLGEEGRKRAVVVAAPADCSPVLRLHGAALATRIAEDFRDRGKHVLLLMDSLTRYAQAQREIALAVGEPPATKGYPPSVFAKLPSLVERAGNGLDNGGSITAFYTVLTEGDDQQDPIADSARAILDGHVVLSRQLAEQGHYPAIDIEASISRVMPEVANPSHQNAARKFKELYSTYMQNRDLIAVGAYNRGSDPRVDFAIEMQPHVMKFLAQGMHEKVELEQSIAELQTLMQISN